MELNYHAIISTLGLTGSESEIFEHLLEYGEIKAVELRKNLRLDRAPFYRALSLLESKNLVTVKGSLRKQVVSLQQIDSIKSILTQKKLELETAEKSLLSFQANMKDLRDKRYHQDNIEIYSGPDSYEKALLSVLSGGGDTLRTITPDLNTAIKFAGGKEKYLAIVENLKRYRVKNKIKVKVLYGNHGSSSDYVKSNDKELKEVRYIKGDLSDNCYINSCGSRTLYYTYDITGSWSMIIRDELIGRLSASIFDAIWDHASINNNDVVAKR